LEPEVGEALCIGCCDKVRFTSACGDAPASQTAEPPTTTPHANAATVIVDTDPWEKRRAPAESALEASSPKRMLETV
jgi:hypothetical protein